FFWTKIIYSFGQSPHPPRKWRNPDFLHGALNRCTTGNLDFVLLTYSKNNYFELQVCSSAVNCFEFLFRPTECYFVLRIISGAKDFRYVGTPCSSNCDLIFL
ncbi:unnamed protein product, partial [Meganyctiphanes norvegica]